MGTVLQFPRISTLAPAAPVATNDAVASGREVLLRYRIPATGPWRGAAEPLVTIVQFGDFLMERVGAQQRVLAPLLGGPDGEDIRVVWKNNPAPWHKTVSESTAAAALALEAHAQRGNVGFWEAHDRLLAAISSAIRRELATHPPTRVWTGMDIVDSEGAGASIAGVEDGSPASRAGLVRGERLLAIDGRSVENAREVAELLAGFGPGERIHLTTLYGRARRSVYLKLGTNCGGDDVGELVESLGIGELDAIADALGISRARAREVLVGDAHRDAITADVNLASDLGMANSRARLFVNGRRCRNPGDLEPLVRQELKLARELVASGVRRADVYDRLMADALCPRNSLPFEPPDPDAPWRGTKNGRVLVQTFLDFADDASARVSRWVADLLSRYGARIEIVWRHFPSERPESWRAAFAVEEALRQRGRVGFWSMHDILFARPESDLSQSALDAHATLLGLRFGEWRSSFALSTHRSCVEDDQTRAHEAGVRSAPTFHIGRGPHVYSCNGHSKALLERYIERALAEAESPIVAHHRLQRAPDRGGAGFEEVRDASVVVTDQRHIACALRHQPHLADVPFLVASGEEARARKLVRAARDYGVPVVENAPVARALKALAVGSDIPRALYAPVADIIRAVSRSQSD